MMKAAPANVRLGTMAFIAGFLAIFIATRQPILAMVVGAALFALFYLGILKARS